MSSRTIQSSTEILTDEEKATLTKFFKHTGEDGESGIAVLADLIEDEPELAEQVAAIALATVQQRLPNFTCFDGGGQFVSARKFKPTRARRVMVVPRYLCTINWAMSGPGFSWPEAYHCTFLPGFDCHVVTASADSDDLYGCCDYAIGWFRNDVDQTEGATEIVRAWWENARDCREHEGWFAFVDAGSIDRDEATALRESVWPECEEADEEDAEETEESA
jgi:hypothetical protein